MATMLVDREKKRAIGFFRSILYRNEIGPGKIGEAGGAESAIDEDRHRHVLIRMSGIVHPTVNQ